MTTAAAVFMSGTSQALRLPKAFQLTSKRVTFERRSDEIVLREVPQTMKEFLDKLPIIEDWPDIGDEGPVGNPARTRQRATRSNTLYV